MPNCVAIVVCLAGPLVFWCFMVVDQEKTGIERMNYCSQLGDPLASFGVPSSWCITQSIHGFPKLHQRCVVVVLVHAEHSAGVSWKLNPQCSVGGVFLALQESRADVCTEGGPASIGCDAQDEVSSHPGKSG